MSLEDEYFCPNCNAILNDQLGFDPDCGTWTCTECGKTLYGDDVEETIEKYEGVVWYCDSCGAVLNKQLGFYDSCGTWYCTECGNANSINDNEIYESEKEYQSQRPIYECPYCGEELNGQTWFDENYTYTCSNCNTCLQKENDEYKIVYECPSCGAILNNQSGFCEEDTYTCSSCYACLKKNNNEYELMFICPVCESDLSEQRDFDEDDNWTCEICGEKLYKDDSHYEMSFENIENESDDKFNESDCLHKSREYNFTASREEYEPKERTSSYTSTKKPKLKRKLQWKTKFKIVLGLLIIALIAIGYYEITNLIPVKYSSEMLVGNQYEEVVDKLEDIGFSNVSTKKIADLSEKQIADEYVVTEVKIGWIKSFSDTVHLPYNFPVTVTYHTVKEIAVPMSSKDAKGSNYIDVEEAFKDAGFISVSTKVEYDIITGWLTKDGEVESVIVDGNQKYDSGDEYKLNSDVVITYHTFRKNKPK